MPAGETLSPGILRYQWLNLHPLIGARCIIKISKYAYHHKSHCRYQNTLIEPKGIPSRQKIAKQQRIGCHRQSGNHPIDDADCTNTAGMRPQLVRHVTILFCCHLFVLLPSGSVLIYVSIHIRQELFPCILMLHVIQRTFLTCYIIMTNHIVRGKIKLAQ